MWKQIHSELIFDVGDTSKEVEVEVLYDNDREIRESFMLIMDPDENFFASLDVWDNSCCVSLYKNITTSINYNCHVLSDY